MIRTLACWFGALAIGTGCGHSDDDGLPDARYADDFDTVLVEAPPPASREPQAVFRFTATEDAGFTCRLDDAAPVDCTSPWQTPVAEGDHVVVVQATRTRDGAIDPTPPVHPWRVDRRAPELVFVDTPPSLTALATATFSFAADEPGVTYTCQLDGGEAFVCGSPHTTEPLSPGTHTLVVTAIDAAGNPAGEPLTFTWTYDDFVPDTSLGATPAALVAAGAAAATFLSPDGQAGTSFACRVDGVVVEPCTSPLDLGITAVDAGFSSSLLRTLEVTAVSAAGARDPTPAVYVWEVDASEPETTWGTPPAALVGAAGQQVDFAADAGGLSLACALLPPATAPLAADWGACTSPYFLGGSLGAGDHVLHVRSTNRVGTVDSTPLVGAFTFDPVPPVVTITGAPASPQPWRTTGELTFVVDDVDATTACRVGTSAFAPCASPWPTPRLRGGPATAEVRAIDLAGNDASATTSWSVTPPAWSPATPPRRSFHALAYDAARDEVVLFGGTPNNSYGSRLGDTWTWDGNAWTARPTPTAPSPRLMAAMADDPARGHVILFGGATGAGQTSGETWRWDGTTWSLLAPATSPGARDGAVLAFHAATGRLVLFGGSSNTTAGAALADTWTWDGSTWTDAAPATAPPPRSVSGIAPLSSGVLLIFGGRSPSNVALADTWQWNGVTWAALAPPTSPPGRWLPALSRDDLGRAILVGGFGGAGELNDSWTFDGATWTATATRPNQRQAAAMTYDETRGEAFLTGGTLNSGVLYEDDWRFRADTWTRAVPRHNFSSHTVAYDPDRGELVYFYGGETWTWSGGAGWTLESTPVNPGPRSLARMVWDDARRELVLFGGAVPNQTTWTWDGSAWTDRTPPGASPPSRFIHEMAFDRARGEVVLFGGNAGTPVGFSDTWLWDGTSWTQAAPATSPPGRDGFGMAYDAVREHVVLFGGLGCNQGCRLNDTWSWDGSTWTAYPIAPDGPLGRNYHTLVWDPAHEAVLLYSGVTWSGQLGDLWAWTGAAWEQELLQTGAPVPRRYPQMAYDADEGAVMLIGGRDTSGVDRIDVTRLR